MMAEGLGPNFKPFPSLASISGQSTSESSCSAGSFASYPSGAAGVPATYSEDNAVVLTTCSTNDMDHAVTLGHTGYEVPLPRSGSDLSLDSGTAMDDVAIAVNCKCPCGRTDFSHILNPPPDCLANRHSDSRSFPELDMKSSKDKKKAQKQLKMELEEQTRIIKQEFRTFGLAVYNYAKSIPDVESILKESLSLDGKVVETLDFKSLYPKFREGADFINFDILLHCLTLLKSSDRGEENELRHLVEEAAKRYEASFQEFAQQRVIFAPTILQNANGRPNSVCKELKIKVEEDFQSFPIERLNYFKKVLRRILKLPPGTYLRVTSVREGCVEICFDTIGSHVDAHLSLNDVQKLEMLANNITLLTYDGQVPYCCCELFSDESSRDTIGKVYTAVCLADYQKDELDDVDGSDQHALDCPYLSPQASIEDVCSIEECSSCGIRLPRCSLEYHLLRCERSDSSCPSSSDESNTEEMPCAKQVFSGDLLAPTYSDPNNLDHLLARSEFKHRGFFFERSLAGGHEHPPFGLMRECLANTPEKRPTTLYEAIAELLEAIAELLEAIAELLEEVESERNGELEVKIALQREVVEKDRILERKDEQLTEKDAVLVQKNNQFDVVKSLSSPIDSIGMKGRDACYRIKGGEKSLEDVGHILISKTIERDHLLSTGRGNPTDVKSEVDHYRQQVNYDLTVSLDKALDKDAFEAVYRQQINDDLTVFLDKPLGKGAFGTVFKGSYRGEICATKVLFQIAMEMQANIPATKSEDASDAIDRESDFLKSFQHPNVVQFLSTAKHPKSGGTILIVELMDCNLRSYLSGLNEESLTSECEISLSKDIACGLAYIHSKQIIHRDLCGDNVLLKLPVPVAKISDFGMSRLYDPAKLSSTLTAIGHRRGYLPPEADRLEEENCDNSLDVFSLGVIMTQIVRKLETIESAKCRSFHVSQIPHTHSLRKLIDSCLQEDMRRRPSARDIYSFLIRDSDPAEATKSESKDTQPVTKAHREQVQHKDTELVRRDAIIQQQRQGPPPRELRPPSTTQQHSNNNPTEQLFKLTESDFRKFMESTTRISFLLTGKTGCGKSTLINRMLELKVDDDHAAKEGGSIKARCTTEVTMHPEIRNGVSITVLDSPGLQDGTTDHDKYLQQIKLKCSQQLDLTMYCITMVDKRFVRGSKNPDVVAMEKLTKEFGSKFWKNTIIVLTHANTMEAFNVELSKEDKAKAFEAKVEEWKDQIRSILIDDIKVPQQIVHGIRIVPAGHARKPNLPGIEVLSYISLASNTF